MREQIRQDDVYSREAEAGCIGSLIMVGKTEPSRIGEIISILDVDDFYLPEHKVMYEVICDIYIKTSTLDVVLLREKLKQGKELESVGGVDAYVVEIVETVTSEANLDYFMEIIKRKAKNRQVIEAGQTIYDISIDLGQPDEKVQQIQEIALNLTPIESKTDIYKIEDVAQEGMEDLLENKSSLKTGFEKLDWHLGGLHSGDMVVVAARPSMGKTAFATDLSLNMSRAGESVAIYSLETTRTQLVQRMLCNIARVDMHKIRQHNCTPEEVNELANAATTLSKYNLLIMDFSQLTPETFRASLKMVKHRFGVDCAIVDYLQLMSGGRRSETREREVSAISRGIKSAAKGEELPIIVLSQLNRECEHRMSHKPQLSDLRDSGSIEQDADIVILLHRPDYYHRGEENYKPTKNGIFQVAKSRNGPIGELELQFSEKYVSFGNITGVEEW